MIVDRPSDRGPVILRDHPGYRILFHPSGRDPGILLITFGSVSSGITTRGWGTGFSEKHGYDHIYVAQRNGSQYQDLPLKDFQEAVAPYAARYSRVITYGASLGGYCAIYYGGCIDAQVIAISPHNSAHPLIRRGGFAHLPFAHQEIVATPRSSKTPVIVYDPTLPDDQAFIDYLIRPAYPQLRLACYPHGGHALLDTMREDGVLADFIVPLIEDDELRQVPLRQNGSRIWHAEYGRDLLQHGRYEEAEPHLRESIRLGLNKHAARSLVKVYARTGRAEQHAELNSWLDDQRLQQDLKKPAWLPLRKVLFQDRPVTVFESGAYRPGEPPAVTVEHGKRTVLASQPGYRITYRGAPESTASLVIGFGRANVGLKNWGMGRTFTREHGLDYVYVGQRLGSDYQELSLESFRAALAPILDRYDHVLAVGAGLGGYAALYYAGSIGARAVAFNPLLNCHPDVGRPRGGPYLHRSLNDVSVPTGDPVIVWDPAKSRQNGFIRRVVKPTFPGDGYYPLETDSPNAYGPLRDAGKLDDLLMGRLNGDPLPQALSLGG